jgi:nucleolar protein 56
MTILTSACTDNPTPKFGEALRAQVEERLNFFETGAPPSKNADAIRKVLDDLALEDDDEDADVDMPLTTLEPSPKKEKKKKRKSDAMDVDEDEDDEEPSAKKVKLSKEEKKALKKAKKEAAKAEGVSTWQTRLSTF